MSTNPKLLTSLSLKETKLVTIKFANQGVRQPVWKTVPVTNGQILKPGMTFECFYSVDKNTETLTIPQGTIGIFHVDVFGNSDTPMKKISISVIRDDCKAARKAIRLAEATPEELKEIAKHKKVSDPYSQSLSLV